MSGYVVKLDGFKYLLVVGVGVRVAARVVGVLLLQV